MAESAVAQRNPTNVSEMAETLIGSEIIKLASEIHEKIKKGERIFNYTIGDFNPEIFPIPVELTDDIIRAYSEKHTNYPAANGMIELRNAVADFLTKRLHLSFHPDEVLISAGARPLIYAVYVTLLDPGDTVIFPVPSWNNNHYCHLARVKPLFIETHASQNFMPTAEDIRPHIQKANLIALCSPLNPTGTVFGKKQLEDICDLILEENKRRGKGAKPVYLLYDQIYWMLTYGDTIHYNPVSLRPDMRDYTLFIDGISKSFAATGVRVGWGTGPKTIIDKMRSILSHVGAWAPKAEQLAVADFLNNKKAVDDFLNHFKNECDKRLEAFYKGFIALKKDGFQVDAIAPQAAIYLTVRMDLIGKKTSSDQQLLSQKDVTKYILDEAKLAMVPFSAFGSSDESPWYRLSIGTCTAEEIPEVFSSLKKALSLLN